MKPSRRKAITPAEALQRIRRLCLALPEAEERLSHGAPTFFIGNKKSFLMFHDDHHGDGKLAVWCAAPEGAQDALIGADPERFYRPAYVGHRGWIGVRLEDADWAHVAALVEDAYHTVAPAKLPQRRR